LSYKRTLTMLHSLRYRNYFTHAQLTIKIVF